MPFKLSTRLPSFEYRGFYRYSVTICTHQRQHVLACDDSAALIRTQLQITAGENGMAVIAYCLMPDHMHLLPEGTHDDADFLTFMRAFKQRTAFYWKQRFGQRLWQRGYIDHVLRENEDTFRVARYILDNPVRAGLVLSPEDYPYSGSMIMELGELLDALRRT
jgi:REP element-mobilizing transposase RayT